MSGSLFTPFNTSQTLRAASLNASISAVQNAANAASASAETANAGVATLNSEFGGFATLMTEFGSEISDLSTALTEVGVVASAALPAPGGTVTELVVFSGGLTVPGSASIIVPTPTSSGQAAPKGYVDSAFASASSATSAVGVTASNALQAPGGTVTELVVFSGGLTVPGSASIIVPTPTSSGQAANKTYVDTAVSSAGGTLFTPNLTSGVSIKGVKSLYTRPGQGNYASVWTAVNHDGTVSVIDDPNGPLIISSPMGGSNKLTILGMAPPAVGANGWVVVAEISWGGRAQSGFTPGLWVGSAAGAWTVVGMDVQNNLQGIIANQNWNSVTSYGSGYPNGFGFTPTANSLWFRAIYYKTGTNNLSMQWSESGLDGTWGLNSTNTNNAYPAPAGFNLIGFGYNRCGDGSWGTLPNHIALKNWFASSF